MQRFLCALMLLWVSLAQAEEPIHVQILALNDFHGNLEPPTGSLGKINGVEAGGAEYLATHLNDLRKNHQFSITVSAGDLFGASPLLSALFNEKPTIEAMNLMGLDLNAVGNHEFDKGQKQLLNLAHGGCLNNSCSLKTMFNGAKFGFLSANVIVDATGKTLFPAYEIREFGNVKVAFVGLVLERVDLLVMAEKIDGLTFLPEASAVNALIPELKNRGVNTVVVLIHEGGSTAGSFNGCDGISGPIVSIAKDLHEDVAVILSGHTHQAYNCRIGNKLVTSAASNGRLVTNVDMVMDPATNKLISVQADNLIITRDVEKDKEQTALIKRYKEIAAPITNRVVGKITEDLFKAVNGAGESPLGKVIADAQLEASRKVLGGEAEIAFMNPGGIRTDLSYVSSLAMEGDGNVTYAEAYSVQPFGNILSTTTMTGKEIIEVLEQQFAGCGFDQTRILQVSKGFTYGYKANAKACQKIDQPSVMINGERLELDKDYRVTANNFLLGGGDGFAAFKKGKSQTVIGLDIDALEAYLGKNSPLLLDRAPRILRLE
jgi:5'-nucleotidase